MANTVEWNRTRYNFYAPFYNLIKPLFHRARQRSLSQLPMKMGDKILILGVGTGLDLEFIPAGVQVSAVDISPVMVAHAEKKARNLGLDFKAEVMDASCLNYKDNQFDAVILHLILAVMPDPEACAKEVARILKPDGVAIVFDKFLKENTSPSPIRRGLNLITNYFFSDINRHIEPIIIAGDLKIIQREPDLFGGAFQRIILQPNT